MSDHKEIATVFFRVFGVSDIAYAVLYWLYSLLISHYTSPGALIVATLCSFVYLILGALLIILSKRLAALVVRGLDHG
jgi:hypothetical protein